jgi:hypothetical protein
MPINTVGAQHSVVTFSDLIRAKISGGATLRKQTCTPPTAVIVHVNVQPFAWNIGRVHR